jgi:Domain of unknown function (DUF932)
MESTNPPSGISLSMNIETVDDAVILDEISTPVENRDVSSISATETDGITINRSKAGISPFVPIVKTPTYSAHSGTLSGYSVEIEDPEADTGYRCVGNVSPRYLLLSNQQVRDLACEIAQKSRMEFRESRIFWDGSRFLHIIDFLDHSMDVADGDGVGLSLITKSSYDKSWRFDMALMGKRFVCDNGMLSGEFFARVGFRHSIAGQESDWQDVVRQGMSVIESAPENLARFVHGLRKLRRTPMTDGHMRHIWGLSSGIGDAIKGQIMSRYVTAEEPTLFGFLNAGTNVFWHREKMTASDFGNNDVFSTNMLRYAFDHLK